MTGILNDTHAGPPMCTYFHLRTIADSPPPFPRIPLARMELKAEEEEVGGVQPVSIQAFASSSTLHGLAHIFSYERLSLKRALWALCFLGSLAVLLCVCTERVQYYFHYHHVTKLDEVAASQLTFPAVTLCNLNEFRFSQVSKNDLYHAGELLALLNNRWAALTHPLAGLLGLACMPASRYPHQGTCLPDPSVEPRHTCPLGPQACHSEQRNWGAAEHVVKGTQSLIPA